MSLSTLNLNLKMAPRTLVQHIHIRIWTFFSILTVPLFYAGGVRQDFSVKGVVAVGVAIVVLVLMYFLVKQPQRVFRPFSPVGLFQILPALGMFMIYPSWLTFLAVVATGLIISLRSATQSNNVTSAGKTRSGLLQELGFESLTSSFPLLCRKAILHLLPGFIAAVSLWIVLVFRSDWVGFASWIPFSLFAGAIPSMLTSSEEAESVTRR